MKAGELANRFSVNVNTVRHYVRSGLLSPDKDASGYHYFSAEEERQLDGRLLQFPLGLNHFGFP